MIVISNYVKNINVKIEPHYIIRINVAWIKTIKELEDIIDSNDNKIYLDYPLNRTKPPKTTLTIREVVEVAKKKDNVKYFAFSNAEELNFIYLLRESVPDNIKLIPKIETKIGVNNLINIVEVAKTDTIMLDCEDLYVDCNTDMKTFIQNTLTVEKKCLENNIKCLKLRGVVFSDD